jgi:hypothetical protein
MEKSLTERILEKYPMDKLVVCGSQIAEDLIEDLNKLDKETIVDFVSCFIGSMKVSGEETKNSVHLEETKENMQEIHDNKLYGGAMEDYADNFIKRIKKLIEDK